MTAGALFDTNIVIDALNRHRPAFDAIKEHGQGAITVSRITWIEVLAGAKPPVRVATEAFLRGCQIVELTPEIAARTAEVRQSSRLKLGDAIIWATALETGRTLVTRDTDFRPGTPGVHHPYEL
jgi:predicted nucleic acid-binding protein